MGRARRAQRALSYASNSIAKAVPVFRRFRWLVFVVLVSAFGLGPLTTSLKDVERNYGEVAASDWQPTNVWLKSTECARDTNAWLALCGDNGKLIPIAEEALGDDPGHALLLDVWAALSDEAATLVDVARLNIGLNGLGFLMLAGFLFAIRAYICALLFLYLGPIVYLKWIGSHRTGGCLAWPAWPQSCPWPSWPRSMASCRGARRGSSSDWASSGWPWPRWCARRSA